MATQKEYLINKSVKVLTRDGSKVEVGFIRSNDGRVMYFNPVRGIGTSWIDQLDDAIEIETETKYEFA